MNWEHEQERQRAQGFELDTRAGRLEFIEDRASGRRPERAVAAYSGAGFKYYWDAPVVLGSPHYRATS